MPNDEQRESRKRPPRTPSRSPSPRSNGSVSPPPPRNRSRSPLPPLRRSHSPIDRNRRGGGHTNRAVGADVGREDDGMHFSNYYRSRFGGQSPEEYQNLRVTNIDPKVSNDDLRDALEKMDKYGDLQIKIVNSRDPYGRIAYVNFERAGDAKDARKGYLTKLVSALGHALSVDPTGVVRDQEGRSVNSNSGGGDRGPSYDRGGGYRSSRDTYGGDRGRGGNGDG